VSSNAIPKPAYSNSLDYDYIMDLKEKLTLIKEYTT